MFTTWGNMTLHPSSNSGSSYASLKMSVWTEEIEERVEDEADAKPWNCRKWREGGAYWAIALYTLLISSSSYSNRSVRGGGNAEKKNSDRGRTRWRRCLREEREERGCNVPADIGVYRETWATSRSRERRSGMEEANNDNMKPFAGIIRGKEVTRGKRDNAFFHFSCSSSVCLNPKSLRISSQWSFWYLWVSEHHLTFCDDVMYMEVTEGHNTESIDNDEWPCCQLQ